MCIYMDMGVCIYKIQCRIIFNRDFRVQEFMGELPCLNKVLTQET